MNNIKKPYLLIFLFFCASILTKINAIPLTDVLEHSFYINEVETSTLLSLDRKAEFEKLDQTLSIDNDNDHFEYYHILKEAIYADSKIVLEDGSSWVIGWWYSGKIYDWKEGDRLEIYFDTTTVSNNVEIVNVDRAITVWGQLNTSPFIDKYEQIAIIPNSTNDPDCYRKIVFKSGWVFKHERQVAATWNVKDKIYIFHNKKSNMSFDLWNITKGEISFDWTLINFERQRDAEKIRLNELLELESKLNRRVLSQPEAAQAVTASFLNYSVGLKDPRTPIGVFLFLGPTGVGKTEMAKVLTDEIYKTQQNLIRFDMSHFTEPHSLSRLIGSPPGYINHEEGGQLTESIKLRPNSVVLLDEIEKAHPSVRKAFLPVFDEGYIKDSKDITVECSNVVFIMTSNLCSKDITELFYMGYDADEILQIIEPQLLEALSPELYNRVEPIVFHPLREDTIDRLVDLMLADVVKMLKTKKNMDLTIDDSVREYLSIHGFHPTLGARPLKKLIQKKVSATLSLAIIKESIPDGSALSLVYSEDDDSWHVYWNEQ